MARVERRKRFRGGRHDAVTGHGRDGRDRRRLQRRVPPQRRGERLDGLLAAEAETAEQCPAAYRKGLPLVGKGAVDPPRPVGLARFREPLSRPQRRPGRGRPVARLLVGPDVGKGPHRSLRGDPPERVDRGASDDGLSFGREPDERVHALRIVATADQADDRHTGRPLLRTERGPQRAVDGGGGIGRQRPARRLHDALVVAGEQGGDGFHGVARPQPGEPLREELLRGEGNVRGHLLRETLLEEGPELRMAVCASVEGLDPLERSAGLAVVVGLDGVHRLSDLRLGRRRRRRRGGTEDRGRQDRSRCRDRASHRVPFSLRSATACGGFVKACGSLPRRRRSAPLRSPTAPSGRGGGRC